MGREIRRVPANWQHPKGTMPYGYDYLPMHDRNYDDALAEWNRNNELWIAGTHPSLVEGRTTLAETPTFADWDGEAPDPAYYRPYKDDECTHFQMYQTVSEGSPVTPVFATLQELEDYLVETGEMAGTKYNQKYSREGAHAFCQSGWAPSMVYSPATGIVSGVEASKFK
jgi:hypothetical protein